MRSTPACPGSGSWRSLSAGTRSIPRSLIQRLDHVLDDLLRIAEHHHGLLHVEERVVEAGIAGGHAALVDDDGARLGDVEDRHAVDRAARSTACRSSTSPRRAPSSSTSAAWPPAMPASTTRSSTWRRP